MTSPGNLGMIDTLSSPQQQEVSRNRRYLLGPHQDGQSQTRKVKIKETGKGVMDDVITERPLTLSEQVLNEIRNRIASGDLKPNDRIPTETELAKQFNVSRASVREALKTLDYLGIVESNTSRGTRITGKNNLLERAASWSAVLGYEDLHDAFVLGTALDTQVAIIAAERIHYNPENHTELKEAMVHVLSQMALAAVQKDETSFNAAFYEYFRMIYDFSQNSIFISLNECINNLVHERVCEAYHSMGSTMEATRYLNDAWNAILNYKKAEAIDLFQNYGGFAYDAVSRYEEKSK